MRSYDTVAHFIVICYMSYIHYHCIICIYIYYISYDTYDMRPHMPDDMILIS